jgi:hypothetical protein
MAYRDDSAARAAIATARDRRPLPLLAPLEVASPCDRGWDDLARTGNDRVRACGGCRRHVYDAAGATAGEIDQLILATDGHACVRYFQRGDGTILAGDCPVGRRRARLRRAVMASVAVAAIGVVLAVVVRAQPKHTVIRSSDGGSGAWVPSLFDPLGATHIVVPDPDEVRRLHAADATTGASVDYHYDAVD